MRPTPRIDAVAQMMPVADKINGRFVFGGRATEVVSAEDVRTLERELVEAVELLEKSLDYIYSEYTGSGGKDLTGGFQEQARAFLKRMEGK